MFLINDTEDVAGLLRCERPDDEMAAALIVRRRHRVLADGSLERPRAGEEIESLRMEMPLEEDEWGLIPPDDFYPRRGTDVIILGEAICREPAIATQVGVAIGPYDVALDIFGDRVWESVLGELVPSDPKPFVRMPITYRRAYGGCARGAYGPLPWHHNPLGKGFYLSRDEAAGGPLPNIESPRHHVRRWDDRPDPVGLAPYPFSWGLRGMKIARFDEASQRLSIHPEEGLADRAHPDLSGKDVTIPPGRTAPLHVRGMTTNGSLTVQIPACPYEAVITVADETAIRDLYLEEIWLDLRNGLLDLTYRKMFIYPYWAGELRHTLLRAKRSL